MGPYLTVMSERCPDFRVHNDACSMARAADATIQTSLAAANQLSIRPSYTDVCLTLNVFYRCKQRLLQGLFLSTGLWLSSVSESVTCIVCITRASFHTAIYFVCLAPHTDCLSKTPFNCRPAASSFFWLKPRRTE